MLSGLTTTAETPAAGNPSLQKDVRGAGPCPASGSASWTAQTDSMGMRMALSHGVPVSGQGGLRPCSGHVRVRCGMRRPARAWGKTPLRAAGGHPRRVRLRPVRRMPWPSASVRLPPSVTISVVVPTSGDAFQRSPKASGAAQTTPSCVRISVTAPPGTSGSDCGRR